MHPVRRTIIFRWVLYVLVILGVAAWVYTQEPRTPQFRASALERLAPKEIQMPPEEVTETLTESIQVLRGEEAVFKSVKNIQPSLIILYEEEAQVAEEQRVPLSISTLFMGPPSKFVIINGAVYREGEKLPDGRMIKEIDQNGVLVVEEDYRERVAWLPPFRVQLKKPEREERKVFKPEEDLPPAADRPEQPGGQQVDLENLPDDMSPDQALQVLQRIGEQQQ
jgi:hypothetical protein